MTDAATQAQHSAARPDVSTWLSANAGSGKTRVLTDRVARLLLDEVSPANILCLTYTKAAAFEMQNRLFERLGAWTMLDDGDLQEALGELGYRGSTEPDVLARARTLFAQAIETPGGLKIQTIHSFCAAILRRFPLEAGISPQFREMDDRASAILRAEVLEEMAEAADTTAFDTLATLVTGTDIDPLLAAIVRHKADLTIPASRSEIEVALGLPPGRSFLTLGHELLTPDALDALRAARSAFGMHKPSSNAGKLVKCCEGLDLSQPDLR
ncbi:MAG: UvrD-helicase domain-containing protein, partial [Shimia sp.]